MSDFKVKMYQIHFGLGSAADPAVGAYSAPLDPLAGLRGLLLKGREGTGRRGVGEGREGTGRGGEGRGKEGEWTGSLGRGRYETPPLHAPLIHILWICPWFAAYWCIQRTRGFTTMRYINRLLLTYFITVLRRPQSVRGIMNAVTY